MSMTVKTRLAVIGLALSAFFIGDWRLSWAADVATVPAQSQFINEQLVKVWADNKIQPSKKCTDYEFVRRVFLDLIGRIPRPEEIKAFMAAPASSRRSTLVQKLLH